MQGGAVLIPAPFPVCDGGLFCFPCFCPVSRAQRVPAPFPVCDGGLFCFPCFCLVSRMQRVPAPFPVLSRFPCAMGGLFCFPCFCLVSRMQRVPALFPRVHNTGFLARSWCCRAFPRCLPNQVRSFSLVTFFSLRKESNKEVGRPMTFSRLPSMDSMMSSGCSWMA